MNPEHQKLHHEKGGDLDFITFPKLINILVNCNDNVFISNFVLTYRTFTEPCSLLKTLLEKLKTSKIDRTKTRVCNILVQWIKFNWSDYQSLAKDESSGLLLTQIEALLPLSSRELLKKKKEKKLLHQSGLIDIDLTFESQGVDCNSLFEFQITEIVKHLTYMELNLFRALELGEFIHFAWFKKTQDFTPNIVKMNNYFNHMVSFISTTICSQENLSDRVYSLARWIQIATAFRDMSNYSGLMQIIAALSTCAIQRLKTTFEQLKIKYAPQWEILESLKQFCSVSGNFLILKNEIKQSPGCIPLLSLTFHDLILTKENNVEDPSGSINFKKRQKLAESLLLIRALQKNYKTALPVTESKKLTHIILHANIFSEDDLIARSKEIEPFKKMQIQLPQKCMKEEEVHHRPRNILRRMSSKKKYSITSSSVNPVTCGSLSPIISPRTSSYRTRVSSPGEDFVRVNSSDNHATIKPTAVSAPHLNHHKFTPAVPGTHSHSKSSVIVLGRIKTPTHEKLPNY